MLCTLLLNSALVLASLWVSACISLLIYCHISLRKLYWQATRADFQNSLKENRELSRVLDLKTGILASNKELLATSATFSSSFGTSTSSQMFQHHFQRRQMATWIIPLDHLLPVYRKVEVYHEEQANSSTDADRQQEWPVTRTVVHFVCTKAKTNVEQAIEFHGWNFSSVGFSSSDSTGRLVMTRREVEREQGTLVFFQWVI